ncbi:hypothetical protein [Coleofasciculus sp.]|uniref:hypothetical protein n=1 Tax=Coleofasciculus sp. TaxID=3100458 RepID=UPI004064BC80
MQVSYRRTVEDVQSKIKLLLQVASGYIDAEEFASATPLLNSALQLTQATTDEPAKLAFLTDIASQYAAANQKDKAADIVAQIEQLRETVDLNYFRRGSILLSLAQKPLETLQASGENLQASGENLPIPDPNIAQSNHRLYWLQLAQNYTEAKQYDRALVTLRLVDDLATSKRLRTRLECAKNL